MRSETSKERTGERGRQGGRNDQQEGREKGDKADTVTNKKRDKK